MSHAGAIARFVRQPAWKRLHGEIERILQACTASPGEEKYWANVYYEGLVAYVRRPRDKVSSPSAYVHFPPLRPMRFCSSVRPA